MCGALRQDPQDYRRRTTRHACQKFRKNFPNQDQKHTRGSCSGQSLPGMAVTHVNDFGSFFLPRMRSAISAISGIRMSALVTPCCTLHCYIGCSFQLLVQVKLKLLVSGIYRRGHTLLYTASPQEIAVVSSLCFMYRYGHRQGLTRTTEEDTTLKHPAVQHTATSTVNVVYGSCQAPTVHCIYKRGHTLLYNASPHCSF